MPIAEFEEKQYETAANIELGLQHAAVFAAGQVLEAVVGYDAAIHPPAQAPIWSLVGAAPGGLVLTPNLWQRARVQPKAPQLPSTYVSLILQYKRPKYLTTSMATQWHHWGKPYFRFPILHRQQVILSHLENALAARAVLRYACPAFWMYNDLQTYQAARDVLSQSTFVSAISLTGHSAWTYDLPGTVGYANPNGERIQADEIAGVWEEAKRKSKHQNENLFQHLRSVGGSVGAPKISRDNIPDWFLTPYGFDFLEIDEVQAVADTLALTNLFGRLGASWFVADLGFPNP